MKAEELRAEWVEYNKSKSESSKQNLVEHYFKFVQNIARKLSNKYNRKVDADELASYGVDGLYRAIEKYDTRFETKFETYAYIRIRGSIIDGMRSDDWVPRSVRLRQSWMDSTRVDLQAKKGRKIEDDELLKALKIDPKDYDKNMCKYKVAAIASIENNLSGNTSDPDENKKDFNCYLIAKNEALPGGSMARREFLSKLIGRNFTKAERQIVYLYYYKDFTMKEIAEKLKMSESRVCQVHQNILERLRTRVQINPDFFGEDVLGIIEATNGRKAVI